MSQVMNHSFAIENAINPNTDKPFGPKYAGLFHVRRASLMDKMNIANKEQAERNAFGIVHTGQTPPGLEIGAYYYHYVSTVSTQTPPAWFNRDNMFDDDDDAALVAVFKEVNRFQESFRPATDRKLGNEAGE